jgi:hypothetical protein
MKTRAEWMKHAGRLKGPEFAEFQRNLTNFNHARLEGGFPHDDWRSEMSKQGKAKS